MTDKIMIIDENESISLTIGQSWFELRRLDPDVYQEIEKRHTEWKRNRTSGIKYPVVNEVEVNKDILDYCIKKWGCIIHPVSGEDVPCTKENKWKLPGTIKVRITESCDVASVTSEKKKEAE